MRTTAEYVVDLRNRLEDTCQLAQEHLRKATTRYAAQFNRKSVDRTLKAGDKVLVLLSSKANKLEVAWRGQYAVLERVGSC
ncbi:hypothetical protein, partial [Acinetobacter baumannii]|uniref:hypothetical protein n=1 Tax=Acinetobacter baumannii TaxID=470 RepID=UPI0033948FF1